MATMTSAAPRNWGRERRIRGNRSAHVQARAAQFPDDRLDHLDLLAPEVPGLPGVRIEPEHCDARSRHAEVAPEVGVNDLESRPQRSSAGNRARHVGQRQVGGHEGNGQTFTLQQHHRQDRTRSRREILGMSRKVEARIHECALLHGSRDHGGELAVHAPIAGPVQHRDHVAPALRGSSAPAVTGRAVREYAERLRTPRRCGVGGAEGS